MSLTNIQKSKPKYRATASNHIYSVDYRGTTLIIRFYNRALYHYFGVPEKHYTNMLKAPSHGEYFWEFVRGVYSYQLISTKPIEQPNSKPPAKPLQAFKGQDSTTVTPNNKIEPRAIQRVLEESRFLDILLQNTISLCSGLISFGVLIVKFVGICLVLFFGLLYCLTS